MSMELSMCARCTGLTHDLEGGLCHDCRPLCGCAYRMVVDEDGDWYCDNGDCSEYGQPYTLSEIENRNEAAGVRAQQTGVDAWAGGFAVDN